MMEIFRGAWVLVGGALYLKYDNCGEVDIQSYAKFSAMSDALNATGVHIVFSYEPHLTVPIQWTQFVVSRRMISAGICPGGGVAFRGCRAQARVVWAGECVADGT